MPTLEDIISDKLNRLETVPDLLSRRIQSYEATMYRSLLSLIEQLERVDGKIITNTRNLELISQISGQLQQVVLGQEYLAAVSSFASEFDNQGSITLNYLIDEFGEFTPSQLANNVLQRSKQDAVRLLVGESLQSRVYDPIRNVISGAIDAGSPYSDLVADIQRIAMTGEKESLLLRYSKQISYDAFAIADRSYTNLEGQALGVEWYRYQGGIIKDTRSFCRERNGKFFHHNEIEEWASLDWQGKMDNTDPSTIFNVAGGYRCQHSILPVSLVSVPHDVIVRNITSGNFSPTKTEQRLINQKAA